MRENTKKDWHRAEIMAAVRKKHRSLAALSRENGLSSATLANALSHPWIKGEEIIAKAIGVEAIKIWPSRYFNAKGELIKRVRKSPRKDPPAVVR